MSELTHSEKTQRLKWQLYGNAANMLFCNTTFFGAVFLLFLGELGMDKSKIGAILSFFPFCGLTALFTAPFLARYGFKRSFLIFFSFRIIFVIAVLPTPWLLSAFGPQVTFIWIAVNIFCFALCKAIAETAFFPWVQEIIPNSIRGRFSGINTIVQMTSSILVTLSVGYVVGHFTNLGRFTWLMTAGLIGGVLSTLFFTRCPGGAAVSSQSPDNCTVSQMLTPLKDKSYAEFNIGLLLVTLAWSFITAFIPLFLREQIGLSAGVVVWLDVVTFVGCLASSYLWGWAADRYGSRSVMMCGPLMLLWFPLLCFVMPRNSVLSIPMAMFTTFFLGCASLAWGIGSNRYLYVTAVPEDRKTSYLAVYYANIGLAGGLGPILAGQILQLSSQVTGSLGPFKLDSYTVLFTIGLGALVIGIFAIRASLTGNEVATRKMLLLLVTDALALLRKNKPPRTAPANDELNVRS